MSKRFIALIAITTTLLVVGLVYKLWPESSPTAKWESVDAQVAAMIGGNVQKNEAEPGNTGNAGNTGNTGNTNNAGIAENEGNAGTIGNEATTNNEPLDVPVVSSGKVDLNRAAEADLVKLKGIGPVKAKAIIAYRDAHGPYTKLEQLMKVKGIGPKTFEKLKEDITITN